ncbi:hypothetical protein [Streptomyces olivaceoviridis]|uniref:hypothetical protein n=1 Tax=Streptomyces olivaceoviridis TaxID=1921 RepID=UPI00370293E6
MPSSVTVRTAMSAKEIGAQVGMAIRHARSKPAYDYPRPKVAVLPADLFREPEYENGEPYAAGDDEEDE